MIKYNLNSVSYKKQIIYACFVMHKEFHFLQSEHKCHISNRVMGLSFESQGRDSQIEKVSLRNALKKNTSIIFSSKLFPPFAYK